MLRTIEGQILSRALAVDLSTIDKEARTVEVAVSSEYPVRRWFGFEVLDHSAEAVDLARLRSGAPLLMEHRGSQQIGVVDEAWLDADRKVRARVRFSRDPAVEPLWQDVVDGVRRNISCGYLIHDMVLDRSADGVDHYRVIAWETYEVSLVSVPADPTVGVGRSSDTTNTINIRGIAMPPENIPVADGTRTQAPESVAANPVLLERTRVEDLLALGERFNQRDLAQNAITTGQSLDSFRSVLLERQAPSKPAGVPAEPKQADRDLPGFLQHDVSARGLGVSEKEADRYSLIRALNAAATGDWSKAGLERAVNIAAATAMKKDARGFYVPHDILMRGLSKGEAGKGGELVSTDLLLDQFADIMRNKTVMAQLGMKILTGLDGDIDLPKKTSGSSFVWLGEGEDAQDSSFDFTTLNMTPKTIAGAIPVTRKLRKQASRSIESLIITDLLDGMGVAIDYAMLAGPGGKAPLGLLNDVGVPGLVYPSSGITFGKLVDMLTKIGTYNADRGALAYLTGIIERGAAMQKLKFEGVGGCIWEDDKVNGHKAEATNQVPSDTWIFGDFSQVICGMWGVLDLKVDAAKLAASDGLVLRAFQDVDVVNRRKESFCIAKKASQ
ncbi:phage major capsid protein [Pseudomonas viridiflava]|uniref:phage major capsid protein n=1 Tax=Pseudomonas viridiflava TaxID=33069 RepID=UPI001F137C73|nr:phage major capsid protein [Pseudomonas viridiflava]